MLTRVFVVVHIVKVTRLLAEDHTVKSLVHEAVIVLDQLPHQLRRHGELKTRQPRVYNGRLGYAFSKPPSTLPDNRR